MMHHTEFYMRAAVTALLCGLTGFVQAGDGDWAAYAGDKTGSRYLAEGLATAESVKNMEVVWRYTLPSWEIAKSHDDITVWVNETTPLEVDGVLYTNSPLGLVAAVDAVTGKELWSYDPGGYEDFQMANLGYIQRGITYFETEAGEPRLVSPTTDGYLLMLDAKTGKPVESWGDNGRVDVTKSLRRPAGRENIMVDSPPIVCGGNIIPSIGLFDTFATGRTPGKDFPPGDLPAFDIETGERSWIFHNPPMDGEFGADTWGGSNDWMGGANVWQRMTCDEEHNIVYAGFSAPTDDFFGGPRPGNNLLANSIVAINAKTGERIWHFQTVHHDLWDYGHPTGPNLMNLTVDGEEIPAAIQLTKFGSIFAFNRLTGEPIWPIEEKPVPQGDVPGEWYSPTQPFPTHPDPFIAQGALEENLIALTPEIKAQAKEILDRYVHGPLFTPPSQKKAGTLETPGVLGGASWAGAAHNPKTDVLYIPSFQIPFAIGLKDAEEGTPFKYVGTWAGVGGPEGLPLFKPPFSTLAAIDMNTGEYLWQVPAGIGPVDHPAIKAAGLEAVGHPHQSFIAITDEIVFISPQGDYGVTGADKTNMALLGQTTPYEQQTEPFLYAYDAKTGELLGKVKLPVSGAMGGLMTYIADGEQYVVVPVGGAGVPAELVGVRVSN